MKIGMEIMKKIYKFVTFEAKLYGKGIYRSL